MSMVSTDEIADVYAREDFYLFCLKVVTKCMKTCLACNVERSSLLLRVRTIDDLIQDVMAKLSNSDFFLNYDASCGTIMAYATRVIKRHLIDLERHDTAQSNDTTKEVYLKSENDEESEHLESKFFSCCGWEGKLITSLSFQQVLKDLPNYVICKVNINGNVYPLDYRRVVLMLAEGYTFAEIEKIACRSLTRHINRIRNFFSDYRREVLAID